MSLDAKPSNERVRAQQVVLCFVLNQYVHVWGR